MRTYIFIISTVLIALHANIANAESLQIVSAQNEPLCSFEIETADTPQAIEKGLMYRKQLAENSGMWFDLSIIPPHQPIAFWMKNTLIPLDILFIDEHNVIVDIKNNAQPQDTSLIFPIKRPTYALEINAGKAAVCNITIGDVIHK